MEKEFVLCQVGNEFLHGIVQRIQLYN